MKHGWMDKRRKGGTEEQRLVIVPGEKSLVRGYGGRIYIKENYWT